MPEPQPRREQINTSSLQKQQPQQSQQEDFPMHDDNAEGNCPYCRKPITNSDQQSGQVGMLLSTECYHQFHVPCFKAYLKTRLITPKPAAGPGQECQFEDALCNQCHKKIG